MKSTAYLLLGALFALAVLFITAYLVLVGEYNGFNVALFYEIFGLSEISPALNSFMIVLALYGREYFWIPVVAALWFLGNRRHRMAAFMISVAFIADIIVGTLMKDALAMQRPFLYLNINPLIPRPTDASYPSGHALIVWTGAGMSMVTLSRRWYLPLSVEALLVSIARVFVGVHWPLDVIGGGLLGLAIAFIIYGFKDRKPVIGAFEFINRHIPGLGSYRSPSPRPGTVHEHNSDKMGVGRIKAS